VHPCMHVLQIDDLLRPDTAHDPTRAMDALVPARMSGPASRNVVAMKIGICRASTTLDAQLG
jgi:hypothetical protein